MFYCSKYTGLYLNLQLILYEYKPVHFFQSQKYSLIKNMTIFELNLPFKVIQLLHHKVISIFSIEICAYLVNVLLFNITFNYSSNNAKLNNQTVLTNYSSS